MLVPQPTVEQTIVILRGLRDKLEAHHQVTFADDAFVAGRGSRVAGKIGVVARPMVEELALYGIRNAQDVATCLNGYD